MTNSVEADLAARGFRTKGNVTFLRPKNQVKRLCAECFRLYAPGDISHNLRDYKCVCVGCVSKEADSHSPCESLSDDVFKPRYEL